MILTIAEMLANERDIAEPAGGGGVEIDNCVVDVAEGRGVAEASSGMPASDWMIIS